MVGRQRKDDETQATKQPRSNPKRAWALIALLAVVGVLIVGELAFQWGRHRGWTTYTEDDGLADNHIHAVAVAPDGTVWIGTYSGGVSRFGGQTWTTYTTADGLPTNHIECIAVAPDGALWFGTSYRQVLPGESDQDRSGGLSRFDGETWTNYPVPYRALAVWSIAVASDGALWADTLQPGVSRFDGQTWTTYTTDDGLMDNAVVAIAVSPDGVVWVGTHHGVSRFDGQTWTTYTTADGLAADDVACIAVASDGTVWFGTGSLFFGGGVSRFDGETWTTYTTADGLLRNEVRAIAVAPDGVLWFGTKAGVSRFDGERWTTYTTANSGLCDDVVKALAVDDQGRVWIGTYGWGGLSVLDQRVGLPGQTMQAWRQVWGILRILGIAASVLLATIWIVRGFRAKPAVQWVLKGAVFVGLGMGVGWSMGMCGQVQVFPADASPPMPPPDVTRAYVGMAVGGVIGFAVLI